MYSLLEKYTEGESQMKDKIFSVLQRVGRSFMLPIAILPVAGLLLGIGSSFTNATTIETYGLTKILGDGTLLHSLLVIMNSVGSAVFNNLPLIFAVGVAIGMAQKEKEVAALSSVIAFFVMNTAINAMLTITGQILDNGEIAENVLEGTITSVCGIQSLQMGVFGGIIVGLGVAALHNRFYKIQLPNALYLVESVMQGCITDSTRYSFRMRCHSLEEPVSYRSFPRSCICLSESFFTLYGRSFRPEFTLWAVW